MEWFAFGSMLDFKSEERGLPALIVLKSDAETIEDILNDLAVVEANPERGTVQAFNKMHKLAVFVYFRQADGNLVVARKVNANDRKEKDEEQFAKALRKMGNTHLLVGDGVKLLANDPHNYAAVARRNLRLLLENAGFTRYLDLDDENRALAGEIRAANIVYGADDRPAINAAQSLWHSQGRDMAAALSAAKKAEKAAEKAADEATPAEPIEVEGEAAHELAGAIADAVNDTPPVEAAADEAIAETAKGKRVKAKKEQPAAEEPAPAPVS